jgi:formylglycine-generating enzyme required for sulfatase activity
MGVGLVAAITVLVVRFWPLEERADPKSSDSIRLAGIALMWFQQEPVPAGMVPVPGGTFWMGRDDGPADERPAHEVTVKPFCMDTTEVTNAQFAEFVKATGYKTVAERDPDPRNYPGVALEKLVPGSAVFVPVDAPLHGPWDTAYPPWWKYEPGACWRNPEGKGSSIEGRDNYPVVQIAWEDAAAFAKWAGKRLPTEAEWEFAARGGLDRKTYTWGNAPQGEDGKWYANTFQGRFPAQNSGLDGFVGLAPVKSFPPNGYGLYDMSGNAWEWCADYYDSHYYTFAPSANPQGPETGDREGSQVLRVRRGGSFLCDDNYCRRYLPSARDSNPADSAANHTGFRCVRDVK